MADPDASAGNARNLAVLLILAVAYYFGAWLCTTLVANSGADWVGRMAATWGLQRSARPLLLSLLDLVGLLIIAVPVGGIVARLCPRRAALVALAVALPATLSLLWNVLVVWGAGFQLAGAVRWLITFDATKTLLLPALFTFIVPRLMPRRDLS